MEYEYEHIEDIKRFEDTITRNRQYYNAEVISKILSGIVKDNSYQEDEKNEFINFLKEKLGERARETSSEVIGRIMTDDFGYDENDAKEIGEFKDDIVDILSNAYDYRVGFENQAHEEADRLEAERLEKERIEADRRVAVKDQQARQQEKRNRTVAEYTDDELISQYNLVLNNLDRMVLASRNKEHSKQSMDNYNKLIDRRNQLKVEIDKRGLKIEKQEKEDLGYSKTGKLRTKKERNALNNQAIQEVKSMTDEVALEQKKYIDERIKYIREQLEKGVLDTKVAKAYGLDLERYEIFQKALEKRIDKMQAEKDKQQKMQTEKETEQDTEKENNFIIDNSVDKKYDINNVSINSLFNQAPQAETELKDTTTPLINTGALDFNSMPSLDEIPKDLGNTKNNNPTKTGDESEPKRRKIEYIDDEDMKDPDDNQGKEKKTFIQIIKDNWKKIAAIGVSALAAIGTLAYTVFRHNQKPALPEADHSITLDDDSAVRGTDTSTDKTELSKTTTIEENLKETETTTKPWDIPSDRLQEIEKETNDIVEKQSQVKPDKQEEKLHLGSILENLPKGMEFQEGIDGGRIGNIGNSASPIEGKYIIDHYCKLGDGTIENVSGTDGKEIGEDAQWVHISLVTEKENEPRGWVKTDVIKRIIKNQNKDINERE